MIMFCYMVDWQTFHIPEFISDSKALRVSKELLQVQANTKVSWDLWAPSDWQSMYTAVFTPILLFYTPVPLYSAYVLGSHKDLLTCTSEKKINNFW